MRTGRKRERESSGKRILVFIIAAIVFFALNMFIIQNTSIGGVSVSRGDSWESRRHALLTEEAEAIRQVKLGKSPRETATLSCSLPSLDIFSDYAAFSRYFQLAPAKKTGMDPDAEGQYYGKKLPVGGEASLEEAWDYAQRHLAQCKEVINFNTAPLSGRGHSLEEQANKLSNAFFSKLVTSLTRDTARHRRICHVSVFARPDDLKVNDNRIRIRVAADYTDLELLSHLHRAAKAMNAPDRIYGVQGSVQITPSMYTAYRLGLAIVEKTQSQDGDRAAKDYETALRLHDYLCHNCEYSGTAGLQNNTLMVTRTLLGKRASSEGYARTYRLLLTMAGIENAYVYGAIRYKDAQTGEEKSVPHCWNLVRIGERWMHVDVSADDPLPGDDASCSHAYFGIPAAALRDSHAVSSILRREKGSAEEIEEREQDYPIDGALWFYQKRGLCAATSDELAAMIVRRAVQGDLETEVLYLGGTLSPNSLRDAINDYLEGEQLHFDKDYALDMDEQQLPSAGESGACVLRVQFRMPKS